MSLISIISANFNKVTFISDMIESVLEQTYDQWELIIVDDCSTDDSVAVLTEYCMRDSRVKLLSNEVNMGGNYSRNRGLVASQGDYIIFMDSDDLFTKNCFKNRLEVAQANANFDLWIFPMGVFRQTIGDCNEDQFWKVEQKDYLNSFLKHQLPWQTCQPFWNASIIKDLNGFDETFMRLQDVELHTRTLLAQKKVFVDKSKNYNCYFRIDEQRIEVNHFKFLTNFSKGAIQYYTKFYPLVNKKQQKLLIGTLIETISNVCYQRRVKTINKQEFKELTKTLINSCQNTKQKKLLKFYVFLESWLPFHPKGLKKIILLLT